MPSIEVPKWQWSGLLLVVALVLRLHGIGFGLPALNDPDELMFELGAVRMLRTASLNPGWFGHPATTTMELLAIIDASVFAVGYVLGWFASVPAYVQAIYHDPSWVILPGRAMIALFGVGSVLLSVRIATRLFGRNAGLAAGALLAVSPVHVTYSQIIRSDMMACFFMLLCIGAAIDIARTGRWRAFVLAALWLGLAIATKWPFALVAIVIPGAALLRMRAAVERPTQLAVRVVAAGALALVILLLVSPYLLIDHATAIQNVLGEAQARHVGSTGGSPLFNAWWYLRGPVLAGVGSAGAALLIFGAVIERRNAELLAIIAPVALGFFALISLQSLVWERWALPLVPLAAIVAGAGLARLCTMLLRVIPPMAGRAGIVVLLALTLLPPLAAVRSQAAERTNDTRQRASQWLFRHAGTNSTVLVEQFAFDLLAEPSWRMLFPLGDMGCVDSRATLGGHVGYAPINAARGNRAVVDYGTLAPARRATCAADYAVLAQYDRYAAEEAAYPVETAAYRALMRQGRQVAVFAPIAGVSSGPVVRIIRFDRGSGAFLEPVPAVRN